MASSRAWATSCLGRCSVVSAEWAQVFTEWAKIGAGLLSQALFMVMLFVTLQRVQEMVAKGSGPQANFRVLLRRIWCRHRLVAMTRGKYGARVWLCVRCAKDVNKGKPREEWR